MLLYWINNEDMVIENGMYVCIKIISCRYEVSEMWVVGIIKEDYLGFVLILCLCMFFVGID